MRWHIKHLNNVTKLVTNMMHAAKLKTKQKSAILVKSMTYAAISTTRKTPQHLYAALSNISDTVDEH